ncbi:hypothetical protein H0H93_011897 [Arthromyces matolae]|nr:hypothetical protein H0H93_011897 [Arthromyces matolae]
MNHDDRVNHLLHTLRGEQFRHAQNLRRSRTHVSSFIARTSSLPTLPFDIHSDHDLSLSSSLITQSKPLSSASTNTPGPEPPKSWTLIRPSQVPQETPAWRLRALSLVMPVASPRVPTLANLCLRILASVPAPEFHTDVIPWLAPHLRRDLIRFTAVHTPLPGAKLWPLYEPNGHVGTELIVVGPQAVLKDDYFIQSKALSEQTSDQDWDTDGRDVEPLYTLVLISTRLATSTVFSFPPTITRMALINLPTPIPLHRLPNTCPLLIVLDLSYNSWLSVIDDSDKAFERIDWGRWNTLNVLGLRECAISSTIVKKVNKGRWDDVQIVQ